MRVADLPLLRVLNTLHRGMRLFHDSMRELAIEPLAMVLRNPQGIPSWRLAAAGLLAETYRGQGNFLRAEHYYRVALAEAEAIPGAERPHNEWYLHYRPRCALGLITVLRRLLSSDHRTIAAQLRATRDLAGHVAIPDLSGQLSAVEGVYRRQCGDLDGAASLLRDACQSLADRDDCCYWDPEHVEAMLLQVQLLICSGRALVGRAARKLLEDPTVRAWSKAVAAACYLHLRLERMLECDSTPAQFAQAAEDHTESGIGHLLAVLAHNAQEDGDPLLVSEAQILGLAWQLPAGRCDAVDRFAASLAEIVEHTPPILGVLRGCELRVLLSLLPGVAAGVEARFTRVLQHASESLRFLHASIVSYGHGADQVADWAKLLETTGPADHIVSWLDGPVLALRCLAWP